MAGLGIGPEEFQAFEIEDPGERSAALESRVAPKLRALGQGLAGGLSRVAGVELHAHVGKAQRRKGLPPGELFVAFCESEKGFRTLPHLLLAVTASDLHARVAARSAADRGGALHRALEREAGNLARKGKPFRKLRNYQAWDCEELPEIAPAHSPAFWAEQADALANGGFDVGVSWPAAEARSLSVGDVLGAFRDLAPLFKLLANAG
jgi:hypothetical protein